MVSPRAPTLTIAKSGMSAANKPYSMRSWPLSCEISRPIAVISRAMKQSFRKRGAEPRLRSRFWIRRLGLRRRRERRADAGEDRLHVRAGGADDGDGDEGDQRDEQRVLEQVLSFVGERELLETSDELHFRSSSA